MLLRRLMLIALLGIVTVFSSCSYLTDFIVVNQTENPIVVLYKVKDYPGPFSPPVAPSTIPVSQLNTKGGQSWNRISADHFIVDEANRTVTVRVNSYEALLVTTMHHYVGHEDKGDAEEFPITEISISGVHGNMDLLGEQARTSFSKASRALYTLTYK